jgi:hypothetical protein
MINKNQLFKTDKFVVAACLSALSIILWGAAYGIYQNPKLEPDVQQRRSKDVASCKRFAEDLGYTANLKSRSMLEVTTFEFQSPKYTYLNVKQLALGCSNMKPISFCLGGGEVCGLEGASYGLKMTFNFQVPNAS